MNLSQLRPTRIQDVFLTRSQIFFTAVITLGGAFLFLLPSFPFDRKFCLLSLFSCFFHLLLFIFFRRLSAFHFNAATFLNLILMGFAIHYTGGILSPYTIVFSLILISGSYYGIKYHAALVCAFIIYLSVIFMESTGILTPLPITPASVYRSWPTTTLIFLTLMGLMMVSDSIFKISMKYLRTELEREIVRNQSMKDQLSKLEVPSQIGLLVNKIAHDIRGPLGAFSGFIKVIQNENELTAESKRDCELMLTEIYRINGLIDRMISYMRLGHEVKTAVSPVELLETVLAVMSFYPEAKRIEFRRSFVSSRHLFVYMNPGELQQVFFNILKNAIEALEGVPEPQVDLIVYGSGPEVFVVIRDNGPGVSKYIAERITHGTFSTKKEGGGIGLLITKEILEHHGGRLVFESQEGKGISVTISLPLRHKSAIAKNSEKIRGKST